MNHSRQASTGGCSPWSRGTPSRLVACSSSSTSRPVVDRRRDRTASRRPLRPPRRYRRRRSPATSRPWRSSSRWPPGQGPDRGAAARHHVARPATSPSTARTSPRPSRPPVSTPSDFKIDNAQGSASTMQTQAEADITQGASVLLIDAIDSGQRRGHRGQRRRPRASRSSTTTASSRAAPPAGPTSASTTSTVGKLIGQGEVDCIAAWNVAKPNILVMDGDPTDNNATLFAQGYNGVLKPHFDDGTYVKVGEPAGTWTPVGRRDDLRPAVHRPPEHQRGGHAERRQRQRRHRRAAEANIPPKKFPTTGQDASLSGSAEHPEGLPVRHRLQADLPRGAGRGRRGALPAGRPDAARRPWSTAPPRTPRPTSDVPSVLLTPVWVTTANMASTVVKDGAVKASDLCIAPVAAACTAAGIS